MNPLYRELIQPFRHDTTVLELGNKRYKGVPYRSYYESFGLKYTAVDINGLDGALPLDLCKPLALGRFGIVTNFGTSEHVSNQDMVWANIIDATDDLLVCATPMPGHHKSHGMFYPTLSFYRRLAMFNGLDVERLYEHPTKFHIFARFRRTRERTFQFPGMQDIYVNSETDAYNGRV